MSPSPDLATITNTASYNGGRAEWVDILYMYDWVHEAGGSWPCMWLYVAAPRAGTHLSGLIVLSIALTAERSPYILCPAAISGGNQVRQEFALLSLSDI